MKKLITTLAMAALLSLGQGALNAVAADTPDSWITAKTRIALMTTDGVDTWDLNVDTNNGVVTLHGKVATAAAKTAAERETRRLDGVKDVKNLLQVVSKPAREASNDRSGDQEQRHQRRLGEQGRGVADRVGRHDRAASRGRRGRACREGRASCVERRQGQGRQAERELARVHRNKPRGASPRGGGSSSFSLSASDARRAW
jgi:hypothetical protein